MTPSRMLTAFRKALAERGLREHCRIALEPPPVGEGICLTFTYHEPGAPLSHREVLTPVVIDSARFDVWDEAVAKAARSIVRLREFVHDIGHEVATR